METATDKLTGIATLGTRRAPLPAALPWPELSLAALDAGTSAETRLLRVVAAAALFDGAGTRAAPEPAADAAADFPEPGRPLVTEAAAWRLARLVSGDHAYLLPEWFALAAARGRVVPPHLLPLLFEQVPPDLRVSAAEVLGPAARWLAARHPTWTASAPVTELSDQAWQEGSLAERLALLVALRTRDTARSREWLRQTWDTDPPEAREAFLGALLPTVEAGDETWLEAALDDKRKAVRLAAVEALARLPTSAHALRMRARAEPLLSLGPVPAGLLGKLRKRKLAVELPTAPDKAAQRDGVEAKVPAARKMGERAWWLQQTVSGVPPRHWCERFDCDAETFLEAVLATDFKSELLQALTLAASRHPDAQWSRCLTQAWLSSKEIFPDVLEAVRTLVAAAPATEHAPLIEALVAGSSVDHFGVLSQVLESLEILWTPSLTRAAFDKLEKVVLEDRTSYPQHRQALEAWGRRCDVAEGAARGAALAQRCGETHRWHHALEHFNEIVAFRAAMHEELRS